MPFGLGGAMLGCQRCRVEYTAPVGRCGLCGEPLALLESDPLVGAVLGRYVISERLGSGAIGVVYRAQHVELARPSAVKVLFGQHASNAKSTERFRREAHALGRIAHPNVVAVIDYGCAAARESESDAPEGAELAYLVMEYVAGRTLRSILEGGPISADRAGRIARQIASGLAVAHAAGFVHRDLKPANIMIGDGDPETAKIVDFGLVALIDRSSDVELTSDSSTMGTPAYMAPEQAYYSTVDEHADLYSLGCIIHHMLSGAPPFDGPRGDLLHAHAHRPAPDLPPSGGFEGLAQWLLEKDPNDRPPDAACVVSELDRILASPIPVSHRRGAPRTRTLWVASVCAAAVAGAAGAVQIAGPKEPPAASQVATEAPPRSPAPATALAPTAAPPPAASPASATVLADATPAARAAPASGLAPSSAPARRRVAPAPRPAEPPPAAAEAVAAPPAELVTTASAAAGERPGSLDIVVTLRGRLKATAVRIDGRRIAERTPLHLDLAPGTHLLEVEPAGSAAIPRQIEVRAGEITEVAVELEP